MPRSLDQANVEKTYSTLALPQNVNPEHVTGPNIFPSRFVRWPVDWFRKITAVHPPARMQDHGSQGLTSRFPVVGYDPARVSIPMDYRHPRSTDRSTPENCSQTARLNTLPSLPPSTPPLIIYEQPDAPTPKKSTFNCPHDVNPPLIATQESRYAVWRYMWFDEARRRSTHLWGTPGILMVRSLNTVGEWLEAPASPRKRNVGYGIN